MICEKMSTDEDLSYDPEYSQPVPQFVPVDLYWQDGNCLHFAKLMKELVVSVGAWSSSDCNAKTFGYGSPSPARWDSYLINSGSGALGAENPDGVTMRLTAPDCYHWFQNPHFGWHAGLAVGAGDVWWDPVYGELRTLSASEHASGSERLILDDPNILINVTHWLGCPHTEQYGQP
jgi:hypothetical protein